MTEEKNKMDFAEILKAPDKKFSPAAFWFWYGTLEPDELRKQVNMMAEQHVWNAFMHSRAYLETEYLGDDWWKAVSAVVDEARQKGFYAWMYDEYAWPSGTAGSTFPNDPHQKPSEILACSDFKARFLQPMLNAKSDEVPEGSRLLKSYDTERGKLDFYVVINPSCVDYMNADAISRFVELTHERYKQRYSSDFGATIPGVFFDEIYLSGKLPWTERFADEFSARKGYDILEKLQLLIDGDDKEAADAREDYFDVVSELYERAFFTKISGWCADNGIMLTGHTEEYIGSHPYRQGDFFKTMCNLQIPGADCHAYRYTYPRRITLCEPKYSVSVARLYNKHRSMSESMGGAGWACTLQEYKRGINTMTAAGISMHVLHGFAYEERTQGEQGDWPASFFFQNPYWPMFKGFADYMSRVCSVNEMGKPAVDVALYYPIRDMKRGTINGHLTPRAQRIAEAFDGALDVLMNNQLDADFLDADSILNAKYENGSMYAGEETFKIVLVHKDCELAPEVADKLQGVKTLYYDDADMLPKLVSEAIAPAVAVTRGEKAELFVNHRIIDGNDVYFIANCRPESRNVRIRLAGNGAPVIFDIETCQARPVKCAISEGYCEFEHDFGADEAFYVAFGQHQAQTWESMGEIALNDDWNFIQKCENGVLEIPFATLEGRKTMICDVFTGRGNAGRFATDWQGKWITRRPSWGDDGGKKNLYFKRCFELEAKPESARICICAVGNYELEINGVHALSGRGWRNPVNHNVGEYLRAGKNELRVHVHNETPLHGVNSLWMETINPDEPTSLLMQLEAQVNGNIVVIPSDSKFIVCDEDNAVCDAVRIVNLDNVVSFGGGGKPGEWLYAWERGSACMQPWGDMPLFGQPARYPRKLSYAIELPKNCVTIDAPVVRGQYECKFNGNKVTTDEITSGGMLEIIVNAQGTDDGLEQPIRAHVAAINAHAGDWRELGMPDYSGQCDYRTEFDIEKSDDVRYMLSAPGVKWYAQITLNGEYAGDMIWQPYELDITDALCNGHNELIISVANTAANERRHMLCDAGQSIGWNRYWNGENMDRDRQNYVSGLTGNVSIIQLKKR